MKRLIVGSAVLAFVIATSGCGSDSSPPAPGNIRLAHLAFGAPAVDFCWAPQGSTSFTGPAMKGAGDAAGVLYAEASKYFSLGAGTYTVRLVPFAANSCATAVPGVADIQVVVAAGGYYTVAAATLLPTGVQLKAFTDEATVDPAKVIIRFVNAVPGSPAVDIGTGAPTAFSPIFSNLTYLGIATQAGVVDANGYASVPAASFTGTVILTTCFHGVTPSATTCPVSVTLPSSISASITNGTVASAFAILLNPAASPPTGQLLLCGDSTGTTPGTNLSACITAN
jgi:hypothetical protein